MKPRTSRSHKGASGSRPGARSRKSTSSASSRIRKKLSTLDKRIIDLQRTLRTSRTARAKQSTQRSLGSRIEERDALVVKLSTEEEELGEDTIREMLSKSDSMAPLSVQFEEQGQWLNNLSSAICSQIMNMERMHDLRISLPGDYIEKLLDSLSGSNAPVLQSLVIENKDFYRGRRGSDAFWYPMPTSRPDPPYSIPTSLFSILMPNLRYLTISHCRVDWSLMKSAIPSELLSLKLCRVTQPTREQFYGLLDGVPDLEHLHLETALPEVPVDGQPDSDADSEVALPHLCSCTIRGSPLLRCVDFQNHVSYPAHTTRLHFRPCHAGAGTSDQTSSLIALLDSCGVTLENCYRSHSNARLQMIDARTGMASSLHLWDSSYEPDPELWISPLDDLESFAVVVDMTEVAWSDGQVPPWIDVLSVPALTSFQIVGPGVVRYSARQWFDFFKRHSEITNLQIEVPLGRSIFIALATEVDAVDIEEHQEQEDIGDYMDDSSSGSQDDPKPHPTPSASDPGYGDFSPCLPNLVAVTLKDHCEDIVDERKHDAEFERIHEFLIKYRLSGRPIQNFDVIHSCWINQSVIDGLAEEVGQVTWDKGYFIPREGAESVDYEREGRSPGNTTDEEEYDEGRRPRYYGIG